MRHIEVDGGVVGILHLYGIIQQDIMDIIHGIIRGMGALDPIMWIAIGMVYGNNLLAIREVKK